MANDSGILFGIHPLLEAIASGREIDKVLIKKASSGQQYEEVLAELRRHNIPFQYVPVEKLNRVTRKNHQGVIAFVSEIEYYDIEKVIPQLYEDGKVPFILVLDHITDVRNFGAIARTAECAGMDAILISEKGHAGVNADAIKTSAGALHHIKVCRTPILRNSLMFLKNSGVKLISATEKAESNYDKADYCDPVAIIMGAEDTGIHAEILRITDQMVRIPMFGKTESLNVSVAAGILIYEAVKQRNH
jgi:23S rRNA (guanosine2251-2'-O)-methyltransferase